MPSTQTTAEAVLEALRSSRSAMPPADLADATGKNYNTVKTVVRTLARDGEVEGREGAYRIAPVRPGYTTPEAFMERHAPRQEPARAIVFTLGHAVGWDINEARFVPVGTPPNLDLDLSAISSGAI